jgi:hypothetical protein
MLDTKTITDEIISIINEWQPRLALLPNETISLRRNIQDRNIKQILGHLIDSASNNIHRMVHLQYQPSPLQFPNYATFGNNDRWIAIQNYQDEEWINMILLWKYSFIHLCHVVRNVDQTKLSNEWISGPDKTITLETMIVLISEHLKLHMAEINALIASKS